MSGEPKAGFRPVLLAWAAVSALTALPYLRASVDPPRGTRFVGFFYFVDDSYNYLSFVQQAEAGSFVFENKLLLEDHEATLVNLEWWLVGRLSALLGGQPILAYRLFGLLAALALLAGADRWLRACGLPDSHRLPALLLVTLGGGLGGLAWRWGLLPLADALDLRTGLFPFVELLANPHFVAGTALLLWSLRAFFIAGTAREHAVAVTLGTVTGLVRPYDLVLLVGVRSLAALLGERRSEWARRLLPLLGLAPVALYNYWAFYARPTFATFYADYTFPGPGPLVWALGPAALLAALAVASPPPPGTRPARLHLFAWVAMAALVIAAHSVVTFSLQFLVGIGFPLLGLGALGLARRPPWLTLATAVVMSPTALVALSLVTSPNPRWYAPAERLEAALALRPYCRAGDLALAPPDIGLYVGGLTACRAFVSHPAAPAFAERAALVQRFYADATPRERADLLDRHGVTHVALPGDPGPVPRAVLGEATPFRRVAAAGGDGARIALYAREGRAGPTRESR